MGLKLETEHIIIDDENNEKTIISQDRQGLGGIEIRSIYNNNQREDTLLFSIDEAELVGIALLKLVNELKKKE